MKKQKKQIKRLLDCGMEHAIEIAITIMILAILAAVILPEVT